MPERLLGVGIGVPGIVEPDSVPYLVDNGAKTLGQAEPGPDAVTVGAAVLPLAGFFARGGRRVEPAPETRLPAWQAALEERGP